MNLFLLVSLLAAAASAGPAHAAHAAEAASAAASTLDDAAAFAAAVCIDNGKYLAYFLGAALTVVGGGSVVANFRGKLPPAAVAVADVLALNFWQLLKSRADSAASVASTIASSLLAVTLAASLAACAAVTAVETKQPLDPVKVEQDRQMAIYLMHAAGCDTAVLSAAAAPIVSIAAGPAGGVALQAVSAGGQLACAVPVTVPATALPSAQAPAAAKP